MCLLFVVILRSGKLNAWDPEGRRNDNIGVRVHSSSSEHETVSVEMLPNPQASLTGDS